MKSEYWAELAPRSNRMRRLSMERMRSMSANEVLVSPLVPGESSG
mgnify:CR=1 FL=1|jgi:hypothetical protein